MYDQHGGKNEWGYKSGDKLMSMALLERDNPASKKLTGVFPGLDARDQWAGVRRGLGVRGLRAL